MNDKKIEKFIKKINSFSPYEIDLLVNNINIVSLITLTSFINNRLNAVIISQSIEINEIKKNNNINIEKMKNKLKNKK